MYTKYIIALEDLGMLGIFQDGDLFVNIGDAILIFNTPLRCDYGFLKKGTGLDHHYKNNESFEGFWLVPTFYTLSRPFIVL